MEGNYKRLSGFGVGSIWVRSTVMLLILNYIVASFLCFSLFTFIQPFFQAFHLDFWPDPHRYFASCSPFDDVTTLWTLIHSTTRL